MIFISDLERVGVYVVIQNIVKRKKHKAYCNCDVSFNGNIYKGVACLYDNGMPPILCDIVSNNNDFDINYLKNLMARYTAANTNGLKDIRKSRIQLYVMEAATLIICILAIIYCSYTMLVRGINVGNSVCLFFLFIFYNIAKQVKIHFLRKMG